MATSYPHDRFDSIPDDLQRVGAHRAPGRRNAGWVHAAWALLAVAVLVMIGVAALFIATGRIDLADPFGSSTSPQTPVEPTEVAPMVNPDLSVTVLNGTDTEGLASDVGDLLAADGWSVGSRTNASDRSITATAIYYVDPANEGAARGVALSLDGAPVVFSPESADKGADLIVVIGSDYVPSS